MRILIDVLLFGLAIFGLLGPTHIGWLEPWRSTLPPVVHGTVYCVPFAIFLTVVIIVRRRKLMPVDKGCHPCPECGYDCRATPTRCPECGRLRDSNK